MMIEVEYIIEADCGDFVTTAALDCLTGKIWDIQPLDDEDLKGIDCILAQYIEFSYDATEYNLEIELAQDGEKVLSYQQTDFFHYIQRKKMKESLEQSLPSLVPQGKKARI